MQNDYEVLSIILPASKELIEKEVDNLTKRAKEGLNNAKHIAISEAWKILQLTTASIIQIIESIGYNLSGADKKLLAMDLISKFYDTVFVVIDIPIVPNILESFLHKHIKAFLMILVSSTIDALVTTFRNSGIFLKKSS